MLDLIHFIYNNNFLYPIIFSIITDYLPCNYYHYIENIYLFKPHINHKYLEVKNIINKKNNICFIENIIQYYIIHDYHYAINYCLTFNIYNWITLLKIASIKKNYQLIYFFLNKIISHNTSMYYKSSWIYSFFDLDSLYFKNSQHLNSKYFFDIIIEFGQLIIYSDKIPLFIDYIIEINDINWLQTNILKIQKNCLCTWFCKICEANNTQMGLIIIPHLINIRYSLKFICKYKNDILLYSLLEKNNYSHLLLINLFENLDDSIWSQNVFDKLYTNFIDQNKYKYIFISRYGNIDICNKYKIDISKLDIICALYSNSIKFITYIYENSENIHIDNYILNEIYQYNLKYDNDQIIKFLYIHFNFTIPDKDKFYLSIKFSANKCFQYFLQNLSSSSVSYIIKYLILFGKKKMHIFLLINISSVLKS